MDADDVKKIKYLEEKIAKKAVQRYIEETFSCSATFEYEPLGESKAPDFCVSFDGQKASLEVRRSGEERSAGLNKMIKSIEQALLKSKILGRGKKITILLIDRIPSEGRGRLARKIFAEIERLYNGSDEKQRYDFCIDEKLHFTVFFDSQAVEAMEGNNSTISFMDVSSLQSPNLSMDANLSYRAKSILSISIAEKTKKLAHLEGAKWLAIIDTHPILTLEIYADAFAELSDHQTSAFDKIFLIRPTANGNYEWIEELKSYERMETPIVEGNPELAKKIYILHRELDELYHSIEALHALENEAKEVYCKHLTIYKKYQAFFDSSYTVHRNDAIRRFNRLIDVSGSFISVISLLNNLSNKNDEYAPDEAIVLQRIQNAPLFRELKMIHNKLLCISEEDGAHETCNIDSRGLFQYAKLLGDALDVMAHRLSLPRFFLRSSGGLISAIAGLFMNLCEDCSNASLPKPLSIEPGEPFDKAKSMNDTDTQLGF